MLRGWDIIVLRSFTLEKVVKAYLLHHIRFQKITRCSIEMCELHASSLLTALVQHIWLQRHAELRIIAAVIHDVDLKRHVRIRLVQSVRFERHSRMARRAYLIYASRGLLGILGWIIEHVELNWHDMVVVSRKLIWASIVLLSAFDKNNDDDDQNAGDDTGDTGTHVCPDGGRAT